MITEPVSMSVPVWNITLPVNTEPVFHARVTETFVPVAVPLFVRVKI